MANEIAGIFKNKHPSTYYLPYVNEKNTFKPASGKLCKNFNYVKDCMREAQLLKEKRPESSNFDEAQYLYLIGKYYFIFKYILIRFDIFSAYNMHTCIHMYRWMNKCLPYIKSEKLNSFTMEKINN